MDEYGTSNCARLSQKVEANRESVGPFYAMLLLIYKNKIYMVDFIYLFTIIIINTNTTFILPKEKKKSFSLLSLYYIFINLL